MSAAEFYALARRGGNAWWQYTLATLSAVVFGTLISVILVAVVMRRYGSAYFSDAALHEHPIRFLWIAAVQFGIYLVVFILAIRIFQKKRITDITGPFNIHIFVYGFAIWVMLSIATTLIDVGISPQGFAKTATQSTVVLAVVSVVALGIQSFTEEFIFRGYLLQGLLLATRRPLVAAIVSGLIFGAFHISNGRPSALAACIFGVVAAAIVMRMGNLWFVYGLHYANNLFGSVVVSSSDDIFSGFPAVITQTTPWLDWSDVATESIALLLVLFIVWRFPREIVAPAAQTASE